MAVDNEKQPEAAENEEQKAAAELNEDALEAVSGGAGAGRHGRIM